VLVSPEREERFRRILIDFEHRPGGDYAELLRRGQVVSPPGVDVEAWRVEIRAKERADKIQVATIRDGGVAIAVRRREYSDAEGPRRARTCESNCAYGNALRLSPSPFGRELGALRACGGVGPPTAPSQAAPLLRHHPCGPPSPVREAADAQGTLVLQTGSNEWREGRVCFGSSGGRRQIQRVRLVWRDLPGDGWSLHEYPANERVASPVLLVQSVQRSAHFGAFWAAAAFNRWPRHDRLLKPSSTELGR
jgi:hypothetical protein